MKARILLVIILLTLGLTSCENDARTLRSVTNEDVNWYSGEFTVDRWEKCCDRDGLNVYYRAEVRIDRINYMVFRGGQVNCYLYIDQYTQAPLPNVRHYENKEGQMWTRTIDYDYYEGGMTIYVTDSDFAGDYPDPMSFRLILTW